MILRVFISLFLLIQASYAGASSPYIVAVNHAPPYRIIDQAASRYSGYYIDIMKALAFKAQIEIKFVNVPFKRALVMMEHGRADLMLGPNKTKECQQYMTYLDVELPRERKVFYRHEKTADLQDYFDLTGKAVAVLRGASYSPLFDSATEINKVQTSSHENTLSLLFAQRVDYAVLPELLGDYLLAGLGYSFSKTTFSIEGRPSFFALSNQSNLLSSKRKLEKFLHQMKNDGTLDRISRHYK